MADLAADGVRAALAEAGASESQVVIFAPADVSQYPAARELAAQARLVVASLPYA